MSLPGEEEISGNAKTAFRQGTRGGERRKFRARDQTYTHLLRSTPRMPWLQVPLMGGAVARVRARLYEIGQQLIAGWGEISSSPQFDEAMKANFALAKCIFRERR